MIFKNDMTWKAWLVAAGRGTDTFVHAEKIRRGFR